MGLVFSYSCNCRNNSTAPGNNDDDTKTNWTFAPKLDLGNNYNISFKSDGTPKLQATVKFNEPDGHEIKKLEIESVSDPQGILTKDNIQPNLDGTLTIANDTLKSLAKKLTSTENIAITNKVTIVFKLTSTNTASPENIKTIENTFNFVKAKNIDTSNIQDILRKSDNFEVIETLGAGNKKQVVFNFKEGIYSEVGKVFTVENSPSDNYDNIPKSKAKEYIGYNFNTVLTNEGIYGTPATVNYEEGGDENSSFYALSYDITYGDFYEGDITPIKVKLDNKSSSLKFVE